MKPLRRKSCWRLRSRRLCCGTILFAYLLAVFGVPVPAASARSQQGGYICQQGACGCQSASECWTGCCCFTPEQRWAWAKRHHIVPPPNAEKPTGPGWESPRQREAAKPKPACCVKSSGQKSPQPASSSSPAPTSARGNHETPKKQTAAQTALAKAAKASKSTGQGVRWQVSIAAQKCRGSAAAWISVDAALPFVPPYRWLPSWPYHHSLPITHLPAFLLTADLMDPPPRQDAF